MDVKDADAAKEYFTKQSEAAKEVMESLVDDSKKVAKISEEYTTEVQKLVADSVKS